jgi:hypothetical protein
VETDSRNEIANLERMNAELSVSLGRCRALLRECNSKLAANSNELKRTNYKKKGERGG